MWTITAGSTKTRLGDLPAQVVSNIATRNGQLWAMVVDQPLDNIGVARDLIEWASIAAGEPIPPIETVTEVWDAAREMFDQEVEAEELEPLAWSME